MSIATCLPVPIRDQSWGYIFGRRRSQYHATMITAAKAIPETTGSGGLWGSSSAPVRKHAPKKNSHLIGGIGSLPFRFR